MRFALWFFGTVLIGALASAAFGYAAELWCQPFPSALLGMLVWAPVTVAVAAVVGLKIGQPSRKLFWSLGVPTCFVAALAGLLGWSAPESKFLLNLEIDTAFPHGFSKSRFAAVPVGATQAEVERLLGRPVQIIDGVPDAVWLYSSDGACGWCDRAWRRYQIDFSRAGLVAWRGTGWSCD